MKTEAIVLHALKYGETKLIVDLFTRQAGRMSVVVKLPKSAKARLKKQYFQPMTLLEIEVDQRPRTELQQVRDARLLAPYASIPFSPEKLAQSLFVAEFLYYALRSEQQNEPLFSYIMQAIEWLDTAGSGFANFHLTFLMHLSRFLGFYPNLAGYTEGSIFDLRAGMFAAVVPLHRDFLMPREASRLLLFMRMDFSTMHLFRFSRQERVRIAEVLLQYYRLHIPQFPELKSLSVLQELW